MNVKEPRGAHDGTHADEATASRRDFLATSASAAAAFSTLSTFSIISPALARGSQANSRVTVGLVGVGGRGSWIADHLAGHPGFQITAVADYFPETARSVGERLEVPEKRRFRGLDGYRKLIESKVDAVFLETPPYFFPIHAEAAVKAGCHVYVAKPVAVDVPGCLSMLALGKESTRNGKVFLVDFQTRADPYHIEAIRRVHDGIIAEVGLITSFYHDECFVDPPRASTIENLLNRLAWVNDTALGGSYIVNCDIHSIDVALWIAGAAPMSAMGSSCRRRPDPHGDSHNSYAVTFQFADATAMTDHSEHIRNATGFRAGCHCYGQEGHLETNYGGMVRILGNREEYEGGENKDLYADGMRRNVDIFHRSIVEGTHDNPTVEPSVNSTLATILGREAALTGRKVTWEELLRDTTRLEPDLTGLKT